MTRAASDLSPLRGRIRWTVLEPTELAILDGRFTRRAAAWPQVLARSAVWRTHGLALSLAISHQARVENRLLERLGARGWSLVALALLVGVGAGLGAIAFRYMIEGFTWLFTSRLSVGPIPIRSAPG